MDTDWCILLTDPEGVRVEVPLVFPVCIVSPEWIQPLLRTRCAVHVQGPESFEAVR